MSTRFSYFTRQKHNHCPLLAKFLDQHVRGTLLQSDVVTVLFPVTLVMSRNHRY